MLELNKNYVFDENQNAKPSARAKLYAVQIPIKEFEKIEEIIEDYGLAQLIEEALENEEDTEIVSRETIFNLLEKNS